VDAEDITRAVKRCYENARSQILSARLLVEHGASLGVAYHCAVLAIEEVGKAAILKIARLRPLIGEEPDALERKLEDHRQKLFWAFFLGSIAVNRISKQDFDDAQLLARRMHDKRLASLYVSPFEDNVLLELPQIEVESAIRIAESRLAIEEGTSIEPAAEGIADVQWFIDATADEQRQRFIFSEASIQQLTTAGNTRAWIKWLKEQFDEQDRQLQELLRKELERQQPDVRDSRREKWKIRLRLVGVSHSVRQKTLNWWNHHVTLVKLLEGDKKKRELIAEINLPATVPLQGLWPAGYGLVTRLVLALNIGSMGFFWWYSLNKENKFYESIDDVENGKQIEVTEQSPYLHIDWGKRALTEPDLQNIALCFSALPSARTEVAEQQPFNEYLVALAFLAKTDLYLNLTPNACARFFRALKIAMTLHGDLKDGEPFSDAFTRFFVPLLKEESDRTTFLELAKRLERAEEHRRFDDLTLDRVLQVKTLCDLYLIHAFRKRVDQMFKDEEDSNRPA